MATPHPPLSTSSALASPLSIVCGSIHVDEGWSWIGIQHGRIAAVAGVQHDVVVADPQYRFTIAIVSPHFAATGAAWRPFLALPSAAALGTPAILSDGRRGGRDIDRGRVDVVDVDKGLLSETNNHGLDCNYS